MTIDLVSRRDELLRLRERIVRAAADMAADDAGVREVNSTAGDQHLADHATDLVDLELDQSLGENAEHVIVEIDDALQRIDDGHVRHVRGLWRRDPGGAARRGSVRDALPGRQAAARARLSEPARTDSPRQPDVRVGSSTERAAPDLERGAPRRRRRSRSGSRSG